MSNIYTAEVAALRRENEALRDKLHRFEFMFATLEREAAELARKTALTFSQAKMVIALAKGRPMTRDQLLLTMGYHEEAYERDIDTHIKRIRKMGAAKIQTIYGFGYAMDPAEGARIMAIANGTAAPNPYRSEGFLEATQ